MSHTVALCALLAMLAGPYVLFAQDIENLKKGVVKITAHVEVQTKVGTGVIIRIDKDGVFIATASKLVEGDSQPQITFSTDPKRSLPARTLALEGTNPDGLAVLLVQGRLPPELLPLTLVPSGRVPEGEKVHLMGVRGISEAVWIITEGVLSGRAGRLLAFFGPTDENNVGSPLIFNGQVMGIVSSVGESGAEVVPTSILRTTLEGWSVRPVGREIIGQDGAPMVLVPAGEFWMGLPEGQASQDEYPHHQVYLDTFYLDKYEVTNSRYAKFLQARQEAGLYKENYIFYGCLQAAKVPRNLCDYLEGFSKYGDSPKYGNYPAVFVDWYHADAYCRWAGKRLPTEAEWEKAARGIDERIFPWGNDTPHSGHANYGKGQRDMYSFRPDDFQPIGSYEGGKSPYGIYDLAGNVSEWVLDDYEPNPHGEGLVDNPVTRRKEETAFPENTPGKVIRGGDASDGVESLRSTKRRWMEGHGISGSSLVGGGSRVPGFRCAQGYP